jgi:hypothetical protein
MNLEIDGIMDSDTRGALVGSVLMRLTSQVIEGMGSAEARGAGGLDGVLTVLDHITAAQEALDGLYLRGDVPAGLEDEATRLFAWGHAR